MFGGGGVRAGVSLYNEVPCLEGARTERSNAPWAMVTWDPFNSDQYCV